MVPIMEDKLLASAGRVHVHIDSLLAYSAVCGTGPRSTIPLPGDVTLERWERIYSDVASLATKWKQTALGTPATGAEQEARRSHDFQDRTSLTRRFIHCPDDFLQLKSKARESSRAFFVPAASGHFRPCAGDFFRAPARRGFLRRRVRGRATASTSSMRLA